MSRRGPVPIAIALGSNVGDRHSHLAFAVRRLRTLLADVRISSWRETEPVGVGQQPLFLNGALTGQSSHASARALLEDLLQIERERGRERPQLAAPRTLDLDLILYGNQVLDEPGLRVPHPRFRDRLFVLEPLAEIASHWRDPETGLTVAELVERGRTKNEERSTKN